MKGTSLALLLAPLATALFLLLFHMLDYRNRRHRLKTLLNALKTLLEGH
jgi:hypothetical protein